jgi:PAS domain S-box-containing protein
MNELQALRLRVKREREARIAAERLLRIKSAHLHEANSELRKISAQLEVAVDLKTRELLAAQRVADLGSFVWEPHEERLTFSDGIYTLLGLDPDRDELSYDRYLAMMPEEDRNRLAEQISTAIEQGLRADRESYVTVHRLVRPDGMTVWVRGRAEGVVNEKGVVDRMICTLQDITLYVKANEKLQESRQLVEARVAELEQTQAELERAMDEARSANLAKSRFIAMISHEIRTPINGVLGTLRLLADRVIGPEQEELVRVASASAEELRLILNDVIDFAKLESDQVVLEKAEFAVAGWFQDTCDVWRGEADAKGIELRTILDPRVPPVVLGDASRLRQVLNNLISNAIKFTGDCGVVEVRLQLYGAAPRTGAKAHLQIEVEDTGIGISRQDQTKLFREFSRVGTRTDVTSGTGLGLAICRGLITQMEGHIGVVSSPGKGSTFSVRISLPAGSAGEPAPSKRPRFEELRTEDGRPPEVLIAEDVPANQLVARMTLQDWGCNVDLASNGIEAVDACRRRAYDAVLMDVAMPEMDGLEATRLIRAFEEKAARDVPIIGVTAFAHDDEEDRCISAGMNAVSTKPLIREHLYGELQRALAGTVQVGGEPELPSKNRCLDVEVLHRLTQGFTDEQVVGVVRQAIADIEQHRTCAVSSAEAGDVANLSRSCHALKGLAATFGSPDLAETAGAIEQHARDGDGEAAVAQALSLLDKTAERAVRAFDEYVSARDIRHG